MRKLGFLFILSLAIISCVSQPKPVKAPEWTLTPPAPDSVNTYFVGYSAAGSGNVATATDDATANLVATMMNFIGAKISVDSTATAKATLESYKADIVQTVRSQSSGRLSGFMIKERFETKGPNDSITVYILASYQTADLNKEKARIAAVFKEQEDAVSKPEASGDAASAAGRWFDAVKFYIEAAVAASGSGIDNADIKAERNVNKARGLLGKLRLVTLENPVAASLGKEYAKPFRAKLVFGEGDAAPGIPGAEVFVAYQRKQSNGALSTKTERAMTDADGIVSFTPPAPDFVGKAKLTITLNLNSTKDLIDKLPAKFAAFSDALFEDLSRRYVNIEYLISSSAKSVPTGVSVIDLADDGKAAATSIAQGGLFESLAKEKFKAGLAPIDSAVVVDMNDALVFSKAKAQYGTSLQRYIYGIAKIDSASNDGSMWQAKARMVVKCIDLATGIMLYSAEKTSLAVGADEAAARRAALLQVSRDIVGKDLMSNLP